jgi:drug/metabolite transporter (DMT)-like permease
MLTAFIILGIIAAIAGIGLVVTAIRHQKEQRPRYAAMLIGGMMLTAFGLVFAGFAIAYQRTAPLDLNTGAAQ